MKNLKSKDGYVTLWYWCEGNCNHPYGISAHWWIITKCTVSDWLS